jgi:hypothetical protein
VGGSRARRLGCVGDDWATAIGPQRAGSGRGCAGTIACVVIFFLAVIAIFLRREQELWYRKQLLRRGAGLCPQCGYALKSLPTEHCPECGVNIRAAAEEAARMTGLDSRL